MIFDTNIYITRRNSLHVIKKQYKLKIKLTNLILFIKYLSQLIIDMLNKSNELSESFLISVRVYFYLSHYVDTKKSKTHIYDHLIIETPIYAYIDVKCFQMSTLAETRGK